MKTRILELIKQPQNLQQEDLDLLQKELDHYPYLQSLRALKLIGAHQFQPELYQPMLSETAAYTTDKKILYQLIVGRHKKNEPSIKPQLENTAVTAPETVSSEVATPLTAKPQEEATGIIVEEEELQVNNLDDALPQHDENLAQPPIDEVLPQPIETQEIENEVENTDHKTEEIPTSEEVTEINTSATENISDISSPTVDFNPIETTPKPETTQPQTEEIPTSEEVANTETKSSENEEIELSFQQMEAFLPHIKFKTPTPPQPEITEALPQTNEMEIVVDNHAKETATAVEEHENTTADTPTTWKPMQIEIQTPDALIGKKTAPSATPAPPKIEEPQPQKIEERQVIDVSFFSPHLGKLEETTETPKSEDTPTILSDVQPKESNVSSFIDTWQNWLKIDREEDKATNTEETEDKKAQIIEKFIETNPTISKNEKNSVKEEKEFVIKDKGDDISHLMTETLANLYVEQHLFSKGIEAYEILKEKHPEKTAYFEEKIQEVKALRAGKA